MADFALQRLNMVESQVRPSDITDRRITRAILAVPREMFCSGPHKATAYRDGPLQINDLPGARARFTPAPRILAKLIQALELGDADTVLEIGAGTGYAAAILGHMAADVHAIEANGPLASAARANMAALAVDKVTIIDGDWVAGHAPGAPYDAILITGAVALVPRAVLDQLKDGGRLATVVTSSESGVGHLTQWRRMGGTFDSRILADAHAPVIAGFEKPHEFVF